MPTPPPRQALDDLTQPEPGWMLALYALSVLAAIAASAVWPWGFAP